MAGAVRPKMSRNRSDCDDDVSSSPFTWHPFLEITEARTAAREPARPDEEELVLIALLYALCLLILSHSAGIGPEASTDAEATGPRPTTITTAAAAGAAPRSASAGTASSSEATDPIPRIRITVLYDNHAFAPGLRSDWGFACLVEGWEKTVLFDTGRSGDILLKNMEALGVDPDDIDAVVLSHAHEDHTGGLPAILARKGDIAVYYPVSFSQGFARSAREAGATPIPVDAPCSLCPGLTVTAPLGTSTTEIGLVVDTAEGAALITGCAHPGIATMAKAAAELTDGSVLAVLGGFHLTHHSASQVETIIDELKQMGVSRCGPTHCTGDKATAQMKEAFGAGFIPIGVGATVEF